MASEKSILSIVSDDLCHGCGTCVGTCPQEAIKMVETPPGFLVASVNVGLCADCGLCIKACPGWQLTPGVLPESIDPLKGPVLSSFVGCAADPEIHRGAQSGGIVSAVLCHLLDSGQIERAMVTRLLPKEGRSEALWVSSSENVLQARGSKYCPTAVMASLKDVGDCRSAMVALGCHVHGLRNAQAIKSCRPEDGPLVVGLVCAGVQSSLMIDYLTERAGVSSGDRVDFRYRSKEIGGWPGEVTIRTQDGIEHVVPKHERHLCKPLFEAPRCRICFDQMNVLADLSVGDPWGLRNDKKGMSVVLARTQRGLQALLSAEKRGDLLLEPVAPDAIFDGQTIDSRHRRDWSAHAAVWQDMGMRVPEYGISPKWMTSTACIDLVPYRKQLKQSLKLAKSPSRQAAKDMTGRKLRWIRLYDKFSPKRFQRRLTNLWLTFENKGTEKQKSEPHILLFGAPLSMNLGGPSLLLCTKAALSKYIPQAKYTFVSNVENEAQERVFADRYGVEYMPMRYFGWRRMLFPALASRVLGKPIGPICTRLAIRTLIQADAIIDIWGIAFTDTLGRNTFMERFRCGNMWILGKLFGKLVVKYTSAIGPCQSFWNKFFARLYMNWFCNLILARDNESLQELKRLGIRQPTFLCPDTAMLLDIRHSSVSIHLSNVRKTQPVIGVSVSFQAHRRAITPNHYLEATCALINHIIQIYGAYVVIMPNELSSGPNDDRNVAKNVYDHINSEDCMILETDSMLAEEIKGVISVCDAMVAARYHSVVAALSAGVPVLAVSWHHKYVEVLKLFGQDMHVYHIQSYCSMDLMECFDRFWASLADIRQELKKRLPNVINAVYAGSRLTIEALTQRGCATSD